MTSSNATTKIYFLTGASGAGKTTLLKALKKKHHNKPWAFLRFDSIGVPSLEQMEEEYGSGEKWQRAKTKEWAEKILHEHGNSERVFIEGQVNIDFIQEAFADHDFENYQIVLIDCSDEKKVEQRLQKEREQPHLWNNDMQNWYAFLRKQAQERNIPTIDTAGMDPRETLMTFEQVVRL